MTQKLFPILGENKGVAFVPWSLVEPHQAQAMKNHRQTLERLAERGGLSWPELVAVISDRDYFELYKGCIAR